MKKIVVYFCVLFAAVTLFSACKSTKGCGLTSDAQKIDQPVKIIAEQVIIAEAE